MGGGGSPSALFQQNQQNWSYEGQSSSEPGSVVGFKTTFRIVFRMPKWWEYWNQSRNDWGKWFAQAGWNCPGGKTSGDSRQVDMVQNWG